MCPMGALYVFVYLSVCAFLSFSSILSCAISALWRLCLLSACARYVCQCECSCMCVHTVCAALSNKHFQIRFSFLNTQRPILLAPSHSLPCLFLYWQCAKVNKAIEQRNRAYRKTNIPSQMVHIQWTYHLPDARKLYYYIYIHIMSGIICIKYAHFICFAHTQFAQ